MKWYFDNWLHLNKIKLDFTQPIHNAGTQEISTMKNELPFFDVLNLKGIGYNTGALKTASKDNKLLEFKEASLNDSTGTISITRFYNELTKQLKERKCYEIIDVKMTKCMTQRLSKTT